MPLQADVVLTTYSTVEGEYRRMMAPAKVGSMGSATRTMCMNCLAKWNVVVTGDVQDVRQALLPRQAQDPPQVLLWRRRRAHGRTGAHGQEGQGRQGGEGGRGAAGRKGVET